MKVKGKEELPGKKPMNKEQSMNKHYKLMKFGALNAQGVFKEKQMNNIFEGIGERHYNTRIEKDLWRLKLIGDDRYVSLRREKLKNLSLETLASFVV